MSLDDARGVETSTRDAGNIAGFESALRQVHGYRGDPIAAIDGVLARDPGFVLGHVFRAAVLTTFWEESIVAEVRRSLERLRELDNTACERERSFAGAVSAWADGDWDGMRGRLDRHLAAYPRDALALQVGHIADFFHGDRENLRGRVARALPSWTAADPGYGFVLGMAAFGLEECGDYPRAEETGRRALEHEPDDGWSHHAVAHCMEMQGRQAEGLAWMESRREHWAHADNTFAFHNWWHAALFNLDQGRADRALQLYDAGIRPGESKVQLEMVDATALLWRMHLQGIDVGDRWQKLADAYEAAAEAGWYAFNDMHQMMAYVAAGRSAAADRLLAATEAAVAATGTNGGMTRAVGLEIVRAVRAFGDGRWSETVDRLMPVRYRANAFGGSHAQRDILHRTLLEAAIRDGQRRLALALATERTALKPHCPFGWVQRRRAEAMAEAAVRH